MLANEHPELACRLIDIDCAADRIPEALIRELTGAALEEEVVLGAHGRRVPRMLTAAQDAARNDGAIARAAVLAFDAPGSLRNLEWFALAESALGADEVEIEPVATGLNFRDVMYAMGCCPTRRSRPASRARRSAWSCPAASCGWAAP
ncbi:hypothetical protein BMMON2_50350 [Burkholderia mallei]